MKRIQTMLSGAAIVLAASSGFLLAQGKYREPAHAGPYRVVISKPIVGLSYTAGSLYREHEYLGAMFNQLAADGLVPVMTSIMTQTMEGRASEDRMLVVCMKDLGK